MKLRPSDIASFQQTVWQYYDGHCRNDMPWRRDTRPYYILVSELMLQQTQVSRVIPKFEAFTARFPDIQSLARSSLADVLAQWIGLGYNRRARFLHNAAQVAVRDFGGRLPEDKKQLEKLPGVGPNTAGAIVAYAFNQPVAFIETNIRTVFIHHFFSESIDVSDREILPLIEATLPCGEGKRAAGDGNFTSPPRAMRKNVVSSDCREWYWALMDYGVSLKANGNNISRSRHHKKQPMFAGSQRQMRGELLRQLRTKPQSLDKLHATLDGDQRLKPALQGLLRDGLIEQAGQRFYLTGQAVDYCQIYDLHNN